MNKMLQTHSQAVNLKHGMLLPVLSILAIVFLSFILLFKYLFSFDLMIGDAQTYWELSLDRHYLFHPWWVPGYPLLISLARLIYPNILSPTALMQFLSGIAYVTGGMVVFQLFKGKNETLTLICSGIYALFPFTGVVYGVFPIADSVALAALVCCFYFLQNKKWLLLGIAIAAALLLQKVTWFFLPWMMLYAFIRHKGSRVYLVLSVIPILLYFAAGALVKQDLFWASRWSTENLLSSQSSLPVFDGLIGPLLTDRSPTSLIKSFVVIIIFVASAITMILTYHQKQYEAMIVPAGLLLMALVVNQYEIWSLVRYAKLISIPLGMILANMPELQRRISKPGILIPAFALCLLSNVAYAYYLTKFFS